MPARLPKVGSTYYFRRVIPEDLRPYFRTKTGKPRTEFMISLGVKELPLAKQRWLEEALRVDALIQQARKFKETGTSHATSPSRATFSDPDFELHDDQDLDEEERLSRQIIEPLRRPDLTPAQRALKGLIRESEFDSDLVKEMRQEAVERTWEEETRKFAAAIDAHGLESALQGEPKAKAKSSITAVFENYLAEQRVAPATEKAWRPVINNLIDFLGFDDIRRIERQSLIDWKNKLIQEPNSQGARRSSRTVRETYIAAIRAVLEYAVGEGIIETNVAATVKVAVPRKVSNRTDRGFTMAELANFILGRTPYRTSKASHIAFSRTFASRSRTRKLS